MDNPEGKSNTTKEPVHKVRSISPNVHKGTTAQRRVKVNTSPSVAPDWGEIVWGCSSAHEMAIKEGRVVERLM